MSKLQQAPDPNIVRRKDDHIRINRDEDVSSRLENGLDKYQLLHNALPEINLANVDTSLTFLGKPVAVPLLISSMIGGTQMGNTINTRLALAAQKFGIPMGIGSQRIDVEGTGADPQPVDLRKIAPDVPLYANLGAVQLNYGLGLEECKRAVQLIGADALILHLNPLQEALQPEGQADFSGLLKKIAAICNQLPLPVIVKEVGWGISTQVAGQLIDAGVACIDVAGAGGTSWALVEKYRNTDPFRAAICENFKDWGIATADCLLEINRQHPTVPLVASGGIWHGIDVAKSVVLGASVAGMAGHLFRAAAVSQEALDARIEQVIQELRITMFAVGAVDLASLKKTQWKKND
jgi:isopentenyl-diphosphate delta-isomerase